MNRLLLLTIILLEGFVSIATEIITIRQLIPAVGNSVMVTSFIIGIFLLALAYGYKRGGAYQADYTQILQRNFIIASALLGIGLSSSFILLFFWYVEHSILSNNLYVLGLYLIVITAPLIYLLGQTVPITMNLFSSEQRASVIGSKVLHLSTIGSFLGSILTTVLFMNVFGVAWTIIINSTMLLAVALLISQDFASRIKPVLSIVALVPIFYMLNMHSNQPISKYSNAYSNYNVLENFTIADGRAGKVLVINNSPSSFAENGSLKGFAIVEKIKELMFDELNLQNEKILVLGAGGFTLSAAGTNNNHFTYVDIDPDLAKVASGNFIPKINGDFIVSDARVYLRDTSQKYKVIISDVFSSKTTIPAHLVTKQYFDLVAQHLLPDGIAMFNIIANPRLIDPYSQKIDNTLRATFTNCMTIPIDYAANSSNLLYVCNNNSKPKATAIYTDDLNSVTVDIAKL